MRANLRRSNWISSGNSECAVADNLPQRFADLAKEDDVGELRPSVGEA